jgi:PAS domain S-box-containing protein
MIMNRSYAYKKKQKENECRQSEERFISSQRSLLTGYWEWNLKTKNYSWCEGMFRIFNLTPGQSTLRTGSFFNGVHPDDRRKVVKAFGKALVGDQPFNISHRIVWPDGSVRFVHGKAEVIFNGGRPIRVLGTVQDITDKRQNE